MRKGKNPSPQQGIRPCPFGFGALLFYHGAKGNLMVS